MIEKVIDIEIKTSLQLLFTIKKIDPIYLKGYRLLVKKNKDNNNQKHQDKDKDKNKAKFHNLSFANSQSYI